MGEVLLTVLMIALFGLCAVTGFTFNDYTAGAFWQALQRALYIYNKDRDSWRALQHAGMQTDFSWERSARGYQQLYEWALARVRGY